MYTLAIAIGAYMLITIPIGLWAARRVHGTRDYVLAGRHLPFGIALATVFATWFGSDSVLGAGTAMAEGGLMNVIMDPFGAALCLILIGVFFIPKLYNLNHLTIGDYFTERYNRTVGTLLSLAIIVTYFGWTAAQFVAVGIVLHVLLGMHVITGMVIAAIIVVVYTYLGGMWSISVNDAVQMAMIIIGMLAVTAELVYQFGFTDVLAKAPSEYFTFVPEGGTKEWLAYIAAWITLGFGSIPQQDVYQRTMAAKSLRVSRAASITGGVLYCFIVMMPLFFGLVASQVFPEVLAGGADSQTLLPNLVLQFVSFPTQVLFFGALVAAIMSTASGAILAPATLLAQNVVKPYVKELSDRKELLLVRVSIIVIALIALYIAIDQGNIYEIVGSSYSITLVAAFIPMTFGLFSKRANVLGAVLAIFLGTIAWQYQEVFGGEDPVVPSIILGLVASTVGMLLGMIIPKLLRVPAYVHDGQTE